MARVSRFGDASAMVLARAPIRPPRGNEVVVRVTHASLGATDLLARRGGYILHPVPGFVTGYDFVGELLTESAVSLALGLRSGAVVAGVLPLMGAHATFLTLAPTLLVAVPPGLDPATAAVLPLDAITAAHALELAGPARSVLVQGASGAVGALAAQLALRTGATVVGTASARTADRVRALGAHVVDHTDRDWPALVRQAAGGAVDAVIDHTGTERDRDVLAADGVLVRTGFAGRAGHERSDALRGAAAAARDRRERVCSAPLYVATRRNAYRRTLARLLADAADGSLRVAEPLVQPLADIWEAHRAAEAAPAGAKVVLTTA
ncbi:zinc-binding dehydrogenase [Leifsonia shinshuensis]|uniref:zinc-binding dehydrogenase n=1 Tax=Leifsonia shinshuensis TaxID=150026 RepID=UPI0028678D9C|nr:zinc-binding dehydrogenase [Leifsonia shinshuensis]MDR6972599.1 NADPH:quinone reductase-like Zn-dependent oxidoreductase [Leifsonia shinshuensis]